MIANLGDHLMAALAGAPLRTAIESDGASLSPRDFRDEAFRRSQAIKDGVPRGAVVVVVARPGVEFWVDLVGAWLAGRAVAPVGSGIPEAMRGDLLALARPSMILGNDGLWPSSPSPRRDLSPDIATVLFTSGSTGRPKGVLLSHAALLGNALGTCSRLDLRVADRLAIAIPYHFTSAICHFLAAMVSGATLVATLRRGLPADFLQFLSSAAPQAFGGSPLQLGWMASAAHDLPRTLRWAMSSGDRLPPPVLAALREAGTEVIVAYGLTEVGGRFCMLDPLLAPKHPDAVGSPIPGLVLTIRDESGAPCVDGAVGEVHVAGDTLFAGYLDDEPATRGAFRNAEFRTGDVGRLENGLLHLLGRNDDVFKVAGVKVSGAAIADALLSMGLFQDVAVIPMERAALGTVPEAWVVPRDKDSPRSPASVLRHLRDVLPLNHLPAAIRFVEEIPRVGSGKVDRRGLRARWANP